MYSWIAQAACGDMRWRWVTLVLVVVGAAAMSGSFCSDRQLFRRLEGQHARAVSRLGAALRETHGLALVCTADEVPVFEWVSGQPARVTGATTCLGSVGRALRFDGGRRDTLAFPVRWNELGASYTLSVRLRLNPASPDQEILFTREGTVQGLKLDCGRMSFFLNRAKEPARAVAYDFDAYGHFVHVAAVVDGMTGTVQLYQDGRLRAEAKMELPESSPGELALGRSTWRLVGEPLHGDVDEVLVWRRALSAAEVAKDAARQGAALERLVPRHVRACRNIEWQQAAVHGMLRFGDMLNPARGAGPGSGRTLPAVSLVLSKADGRYFARAHARSLRNGRLDERDAARRSIEILAGGHAVSGRLSLAGSDSGYTGGARKAYVLEAEPGRLVCGLERLRLLPPEAAGWLEPLAETHIGRALGAPVVRNGLCRLMINGRDQGVYYYEDYRTLGVPAGVGTGRAQGIPVGPQWARVVLPGLPPIESNEQARLCEETLAQWRRALVGDARNPFSGREIAFRARESVQRVKAWPRLDPVCVSGSADRLANTLTPYSLCGSNRSPWFVCSDLDLGLDLPEGMRVEWASSDPSVLDRTGRVFLPSDGKPRGVTLTAHLEDGRTNRAVSLDFRVMPAVRRVPALFVWIDGCPDRLGRRNAAIEYVPEDGGGAPRCWLAAQENRAGVAWRGNTSMNQPKKPLSLRLPEPHGLWGTTNVNVIDLGNPFRDPTLVRNRLCYELFAAFEDSGSRSGLAGAWAEVFINGAYDGLFETSVPMRAESLGLDPYEPGESTPALVCKQQGRPPSLSTDSEYFLRQVEPSRRHGSFKDAPVALQSFLERSDDAQFVSEFERWMDVDNVIDFHLLLDFAENYNGWPFDFAIHDVLVRPRGSNQRFFFVPYDFDTTWDPQPVGRYHTRVFRRLLRVYPGYARRVAERWFALRGGPLELSAIESRLQVLHERLDGYLEWDRRRWRSRLDRDPARDIEVLRQAIRRRVAELDEQYRCPPFSDEKGADHLQVE